MLRLDAENRLDIADLVHRWCALLDEPQYEAIPDLFTDDGRYTFEDRWEVVGRDALVARYRGRNAGYKTTRHVCSNLVVRAIDETTATGAGLLTVYRNSDDGLAMTVPDSVQDFRDRYRRLPDGTWRFAERVLTMVFMREPESAPP